MGLLDHAGLGLPLDLGSVLTTGRPVQLNTTEPLVLENDRDGVRRDDARPSDSTLQLFLGHVS